MRYSAIVMLLSLPFWAAAHDSTPKYSYTVDLKHIVADRVHVELITPEINKNTIRFYIPKMVPGTYAIYDFGRFISDFKAEDASGNALHAEREDINTFVISNAKRLHRISYLVDDTFDDHTGVSVAGMSGTDIEEGRAVVLNGHGFFGYFEGMKAMPFEVQIKKENGYYGASAMTATYPDTETEVFNAASYNALVDMPILYARPDTTTVEVGDSKVLIAVTSPGENVTSEYVASHFSDMLEAERKYMGGKLPVNKYAFLMYFLPHDAPEIGTGALEHNYSSLYVLPDLPQEHFIQLMTDIAAHEFFHIVTPLNVHSTEIGDFDFNDPVMSRHLWMYEGVTEYFAHHSQLVYGLTSFDYFLHQMQDKITGSMNHYDDALPFTKMSKGCLDTYKSEYGNVYQKGALIGLCLDVLLRQKSDGKMGLMDLMMTLKDKYGAGQSFKDRKLFKEITALTYPEVKHFLKQCVSGRTPLPLKTVFAALGVEYTPPGIEKQFTYGGISLGYHQEVNRIVITGLDNENAFGKRMGYQVGDEIVSINGQTFDQDNPGALFQKEKAGFEEGALLKVEVVRKDADGNEHTVMLSAPLEKIAMPGPASLKSMAQLTPEQERLREIWERGATVSDMRS